MADYKGLTIKELIDNLESGKLILPALQRDYVWPTEKICDLFDSIIRDYPIGTFLFWEVSSETASTYVFNDFMKDYRELNGGIHRGPMVNASRRSDYFAVLDGQQRITSIYLGIKGKYSTHIKRRSWDQPSSFIDTYLCIDIFHKPNQEDSHYHFAFVNEERINTLSEEGKELWVKVGDMFDQKIKPYQYVFEIERKCGTMDVEVRTDAIDILTSLQNAFFFPSSINYYSSRNQELSQVVDIFVRVNSGGVKLDAADLVLSVATGGTQNEDIHVKLQNAIDRINTAANDEDNGFQIDKGLILVAGLMFTGAKSLALSKKENYEPARIGAIMDKWDDIIDAIVLTVQFIERIGFQGRKLTSKNIILPVAYYFYINKIDERHLTSTSLRARKDRVYIRQWILRAMITSLFSDGIIKTLVDLRNIIDSEKTVKEYYPLDSFLSRDVRPIKIAQEAFDDILCYKYGDGRVMPILLELSRDTSYKNYHVDHIWPKAKLLSVRTLNELIPSKTQAEKTEYKDKCHYLANLQLLEPLPNQEKGERFFEDWVNEIHPYKTDKYYEDNCIPIDMDDYSFIRFLEFCKKRNGLLKERLKKALPSSFEEINTRYGL